MTGRATGQGLAAFARSVHGRRMATMAVLGVLVLFVVVSIRRKDDFDGYVLVGNLVLEGQHAYDEAPLGMNTWPPVFGLLATPLAWIADTSIHLARGIWLVVQLLALLHALRLLVRLVYRKPLALWPGRPGVLLGSWPVVIPLLLAFNGIIGNFIHLQINILIFAMVLQALTWDTAGRSRAAGLMLGFAIAIRVMPLVFLAYLLYRRRFRTVLWTAVAASAVFLAPVIVYGPDRFLDYVRAWRESVAHGWSVGFMNQSVAAMFDRYIGHGVVPFVTPAVRDLDPSGLAAVRYATYAVAALTALVAVLRFRGPLRRGGTRELLEWSVVFVVGAVLGPVCWKSYLVVLLLPLMLCVPLARSQDVGVRRGASITLVLAFLLTTLPTRDFIGYWLSSNLEMASVFTIGSLAILACAFVLYWRVGADAMPSDEGESGV